MAEGHSAGMFGGAGAATLLMLGSLTAFPILVLDLAMPAWAAALIVVALWAVVAGVLVLQGRKKMKEMGKPVPEQTIETVKEDVKWAKARAKGWVADKKDTVVSAVAGTKDTVTSKVSDVTPDGGQIKSSGRRMAGIAQSNPLGLTVAGVAIGFLAGLLAPTTHMENQHLGAIADQVKETAAEAGHEALEHGKEITKAAAQSAADTAREQGRAHSEELQSSLQEKVHDVPPSR
jgi:gas vesicle protein